MKIKILNEIKELLVELKDRCEIEDMCIKIGIKIG